jgi:hypothetical protein
VRNWILLEAFLMLEEVNLIEFWKNIWGILGPILTVILLLYIFYPEKIETMIIHILKLWSFIRIVLREGLLVRR